MRIVIPSLLLATLVWTGCAQEYGISPNRPNINPGSVTPCGFTQLGSTDIWEYECNPVFTTTDEDWGDVVGSTSFHVREVMGHPFYQMWYTASPEAPDSATYGIGYAVSAEGTDWNALPTNPGIVQPRPRAWDATTMDGIQVVHDADDDRYVMLYQGLNLTDNRWGLGVATSPDGRAWERYENNPVVDFTNPGLNEPSWCWPLGLSSTPAGGFTGYVAGDNNGNGKCSIFTLSADDIDSWNLNRQPIMQTSANGGWDDEGFTSVAVAELDGTQHIFYVAFGDWEDMVTYRVARGAHLGWARYHADGTFERDVDPIPLETIGNEQGMVRAVAAQTVGDRIHLWVTDTYEDENGEEISGVGYYLFDPNRAVGIQ